MYATIEYDKTKYIRCYACGVLKARTYKPRLTNEQKSVILLLRQRHGYSNKEIAIITSINHQTVKRALREHKQHLCTK